MKRTFLPIGIICASFIVSSCATHMKRHPEPIAQKPRDVSHIYFGFDQSHLETEQKGKLDPTIRDLKKNPDWIVQLEGHTDAIGSSAYNIELGDKRARTVKEEMVLEGVFPEQLIILSFGEDKPISTNDTEEGRAENRRVELRVR